MSSHTREPWELYRNGQSVGDARGYAVCDVWPRGDDQLASEEGKANARRIVACVNACSGISNEMLADDCFSKMMKDRDSLLAERNELLEALEMVIADKSPSYHDCIDDGEQECAWCVARSAIAKAKGGTA